MDSLLSKRQVCDAGESETMDMDHFGVSHLSPAAVVQLFNHRFLRSLPDDQRVSQAMVVSSINGDVDWPLIDSMAWRSPSVTSGSSYQLPEWDGAIQDLFGELGNPYVNFVEETCE